MSFGEFSVKNNKTKTDESATQTGGNAVRSSTTAVQCGAPKVVQPSSTKSVEKSLRQQQQEAEELQLLVAQLQYEEEKVRELTKKTNDNTPDLIENVRATTELLQKTMNGVQGVIQHQQQRESILEPNKQWSSPTHEGYRATQSQSYNDTLNDSSDSDLDNQINEFLKHSENIEKYTPQTPPAAAPPPSEPSRTRSHKVVQSPQVCYYLICGFLLS